MKYESVRGMRDILPGVFGYWKLVDVILRGDTICFLDGKDIFEQQEIFQLFSVGFLEQLNLAPLRVYSDHS